ncbi:MAG: HPr kinase/phosphorylase, partial [Anaerotignum sp.]|nr:HPr kinase/phosphorylase [Anaerotignum sp.]
MHGFFAHRVPCLIICKGLEVFPEMLEYGREFNVPIFHTKQ